VVSFDARADADLDALVRSANKQLGPAIAVRAAAVMPGDWDARHSATGRRYRYTVLNRPTPDPFWAATAWHVASPLDLRAMQLACDPLIGSHDFSSFCRRPDVPPEAESPSLVRLVREADWIDCGEQILRFEIEASSFCHQMVRSLVGTMVEMGLGKRRPGDMKGIVGARNRAAAGQMAPPHGLCLWEVTYGAVSPT
jgi:tRNA pseudouridine38-40 synthase